MNVVKDISNILKRGNNIKELQQGNHKAWKNFFDEYYPLLFRYILLRVNNREVAQDLTSDVLVNIVRYVKHKEKKVDNVRAFVYTAARNRVIDYYRSRNNERLMVNIEKVSETLLSDEQESELKNVEDTHSIVKLLQEVDEQDRELIIMRYIDELSHKEIAAIIGKNETSVRVQIHRIMNSIKEQNTNNL